ncbi:hypothetical protein V1264_007897 [Littorina saxatilis]|uniref:Alkaline phosphatase, tissue-nonspecific isozyme n=1 Tax=Littorina saxatilis TaxID=31220 RepID=A0AAN9AWI3_9CAEN
MGPTTVTAGRILAGQLQGKNEGKHRLMLKFPIDDAFSKTYNVDHQKPVFALTVTELLCGVKTNMGTIGVSAKASRGNCASSEGTHLSSILDWSMAQGKSTGIVSTTRVTHATPASTCAHTPERNWEHSVPDDQSGCVDIALHLVRNNSNINVVMGGGRQEMFPFNHSDPETDTGYLTEGRTDNLNLVQEWKNKQASENRRFQYMWNKTEFDNLDPEKTDYLLALFNPSHMQYEADRKKDKGGEPSLAEMTRKAIQILKKNNKGFFLLVEGGRIDHAHHVNNAGRALHDTVAFAEAVAVATEPSLLDERETLIVTTADHSHAFAFAGYPGRGNDILGVVADSAGVTLASDGKPYTTLVYGNGPGGNGLNNSMVGRQNLTFVNTSDTDYKQQSIVPRDSETHGGEDVAIYARGPMAHLFHGVHEQHYIAHVMAYASCVGAYSSDQDCAASLVAETSGAKGLTEGWRLCLIFGILILLINMM